MAAIVGIISKCDIKLKHIIGISIITVSFCCVSHSFHVNSYLKQLNKVKRKTTSVIKVAAVFKIFRRRVGLGFRLTALGILVSYTTKKLKSNAVLYLNEYCMYCYICGP